MDVTLFRSAALCGSLSSDCCVIVGRSDNNSILHFTWGIIENDHQSVDGGKKKKYGESQKNNAADCDRPRITNKLKVAVYYNPRERVGIGSRSGTRTNRFYGLFFFSLHHVGGFLRWDNCDRGDPITRSSFLTKIRNLISMMVSVLLPVLSVCLPLNL